MPQLRLDELLEGLQQQVTQGRAARDRIHTLLDAVLAIGSHLELEVVLQRIVESTTSLVDAKYGAPGVLGRKARSSSSSPSASMRRPSRGLVTTRAVRASWDC
ncbi:hypothetical protein [Streptomyces sp. NPDC056821]|uniref:hypothetical protein n=1 Tax=unclassified Streptomyces TaxID=2593676 RepID=UPI00368499CF